MTNYHWGHCFGSFNVVLYLQDPIHLKSFTSHPVLVVNSISAFALAEGSVSHAGSIALACFRACLVATTMNRVVQATEASSMVFHSGCQALVLSFCQPHLLKSGTSCCDDKDYLLTYLLMPVYSLGAWAIDQSSPPEPALRHGCNFLPGVPHLPRFRLHVSPPGVLFSSSLGGSTSGLVLWC